MRKQEIDDLVALRRALGQPVPPKEFLQRPFDYSALHLQALARDLRYEGAQKDFLLYALPFCLLEWREDLRSEQSGCGAFVASFYPALVDGGILDRRLNPEEAAAVSSFMRAAILAEIDEQRGLWFMGQKARPYRWVGALTTYGVILPDIERLWIAWWSLDTPGRAIAAIQYISCLVYGEEESPVFAPWTQLGGGGPPCLWEFEGDLYTHCWLAPNVAYLKSTLNVGSVTEVLRRAVVRLAGHPEHETAARVLADAGERTALLESRCRELPQILEEEQDHTMREWSQ